MRVYKNKYRDHWLSPYTIIDYLFFWTEWSKCSRGKKEYTYPEPDDWVDHPAWVDKLSDKLTPISIFIQKVLNKIHPKIDYVKIDYWDTWSMDHTLSPIILQLLKQLQATKHGSPHVDTDDLPEELRFIKHEDWSSQKELTFADQEKYEKESWDIVHTQWDWVLNEMIFAFEHLADDSWEEQYRSGEIDMKFVPCEDNPKLSRMVDGPNHTFECDYDAINAVYVRIDNGTRLFGKYFRSLWD